MQRRVKERKADQRQIMGPCSYGGRVVGGDILQAGRYVYIKRQTEGQTNRQTDRLTVRVIDR